MRRVASRARSGARATLRRAALVAGLALACTACGPTPQARSVSLRLRGAPAAATVTVDDQILGRLDAVAARGVALSPGKHRISVEAEGYIPWDKIVEATAAPVALDVRLERVPE